MSTCKGCGAPIDWITTTEGKYMPVDPEPVFIVEGDGSDRFVTDEGAVLLGRRAPGFGGGNNERRLLYHEVNYYDSPGRPGI